MATPSLGDALPWGTLGLIQAVIDAVPDPLLVLDPDRRVLLANRATAAYLPEGRERLEGLPCYAVLHGRERPCEGPLESCPIQRSRERGHVVIGRHVHLDARGTPHVVDVHVEPIVDSAGVTLGFVELCQDVTDQDRSAAELQDRNLRLEREVDERQHLQRSLLVHQERLRAQSAHLARAEERERRRLASVLHDGVGQDLALSLLQAETLRSDPRAVSVGPQLGLLVETLRKCLSDTKGVVKDLRPPVLNELGLEPAIRWMVDDLTGTAGLSARLQVDAALPELGEEQRTVLFQVARELVINVVKHAAAREVLVRLVGSRGGIELTVADDGRGFDPTRAPAMSSVGRGVGLVSARERIEYLGGALRVDSRPGHGARVRVRIPLEGAHSDASEVERLVPVVEGMGDPAFLVDAQGVIRSWNAAAARLVDVPPSRVVDLPFEAALEASPVGEFRETLLRVRATGLGDHVLLDLALAGGRSVDITLSPILAPDGQVLGATGRLGRHAVGSHGPSTRIGSLQFGEVLARASRRLAHELNNRLTVVLGSAEMLRGDIQLSAEASEHVSAILDEAERAAELTRHLLALGGGASLEVETVDLGGLVRSLAPMLEVVLPPDVRLSVEPVEESVSVRVSLPVLARSLFLLVEELGALGGGAGALVRLRVELQRAPAGHAVVEVHHPALLARLGPEAGVRAFPGVAALVRSAGGRLVLGSRDEGVRIVLRREEEASVLPPARELSGWGRGGILVVEDEQAVLGLLEGALTRVGYQFFGARDGASAVHILRQRRDLVRCAVVDYRLAEETGEQVLAELRELRPGLPAVLMSGFIEARDEILGKAGFAAYLPKPFTLLELWAALADALGGAAGSSGTGGGVR